MNNHIVLDASALLALIQEKPGSEVIKPLLNHSIMSSVNIAETLTILHRIGISTEEAATLISEIITNIVPFDFEQAKLVAELQNHVEHKNLSLGDRSCLALGIKLKAPVYTTDKIWGQLSLSEVEIKLIS